MAIQHIFSTSKKISIWVISVIVIVAIYLIAFDRVAPSTSDSLVDAFVVKVQPQVEGKIKKLYVKDNQFVKKGEPLFTIDPSIYKYQYEQSRAELYEKQDLVRSYEDGVRKAGDQLDDSRRDFKDASIQYEESKALYERKVLDLKTFLEAQDRMNDAENVLQQAELSFLQAKEELGPKYNGINIHLVQAEAALKENAYYLHKTVIKAPSDGYVSGLRVSEGSFCKVGETQMAFVDDADWWVLANVKENNLGAVKPGQKVDVSFSLYPGKVFKGVVESIDLGVMKNELDGSNYLSTVDKTNNWVRLAQRFPTRIRLVDLPEDIKPRVGASALVTIYTDEDALLNFLPKAVHAIRSHLQFIY